MIRISLILADPLEQDLVEILRWSKPDRSGLMKKIPEVHQSDQQSAAKNACGFEGARKN